MKRLFDFSAPMAVITCVAYALLLGLFGYTWVNGTPPALFGTIFVLLIVSFLFITWFFVIMSPKLTEKELKHGSKTIPKENVRFKILYNPRFKETQIRFRDARKDYRYLDAKALKRAQIVVQATPSNIKKLSEWMKCDVAVPENATAKYYRKSKKKN
ncbi:MAG: hypothetical protein ACI3XS_07130 [Eubacteriales bacterium]